MKVARARWVRVCKLCDYRTNAHPEDETVCPNDGHPLVIDTEAPAPKDRGVVA